MEKSGNNKANHVSNIYKIKINRWTSTFPRALHLQLPNCSVITRLSTWIHMHISIRNSFFCSLCLSSFQFYCCRFFKCEFVLQFLFSCECFDSFLALLFASCSFHLYTRFGWWGMVVLSSHCITFNSYVCDVHYMCVCVFVCFLSIQFER